MSPSIIRRCLGWAPWCAALMTAGALAQSVSKTPTRSGDNRPDRSPGQTLVQWRFDADNDLQGWTLGGQLADVRVGDGTLHGRATGNDPILFGPVFEISATATQYVEICLRGTSPSMAELFWTETLAGQYGGFSAQKYRAFNTHGDGAYHVYRIWPFWQAAKKIIRLRFDPPSDGEFDLQWVRIAQAPAPNACAAQAWNAADLRDQWIDSGDVAQGPQGPILLSPLLSIPAAEHAFVSVRLATSTAGSGRLFCVCDSQFGWQDMTFSLRADGRMHTYNLACDALAKWRDTIVMLGLQLPGGADSATQIESVQVAADPQGPIEFDVVYFGPDEGIQRAGRQVQVSCMLANRGGQTAEHVVATFEADGPAQVLDGATKTIDHLSFDLPKTVRWQVRSDRVGTLGMRVRVAAAGAEPVSAVAALELTPKPDVPPSDYVPEPKPVKSPYEIGAFYFPGFPTMRQWRPILDWPNRKPVLGWYDESNPECADWQIKWAVEHGIDFYMVDWYWCQGRRQLEHWLHDAYGKARYKRYLKWCVMWANHNPPNTHSADDWRDVTQYWIDHYFHTPEYYRIDDRPVVMIWAPQNVRDDLGGSDEAARLYAMSQEMAKAAGLPGIYFVAMSGHDDHRRTAELVREGFEAATTYHAFQLAWRQSGGNRFPYANLLDTCPELWDKAQRSSGGLLYLPVIDTGWDARPWHGDKSIVAEGRTPNLFGKLCRLGRQFADEHHKKIILLGPVNEWGEGSYIEPYAQYGFQDLDQLRAAFCEPGDWPPNLVPADVGRGPYDLPTPAAQTAWEFDSAADLQGWTGNAHVADLASRDGLLIGRSIGHDPALQVSGLQIEASRLNRLSLRVRSNRNQRLQIFWATPFSAMNENASASVSIIGDGQFHDYEIDLTKASRWRRIVTALRIDPATAPGVEFAIDYIRLSSG